MYCIFFVVENQTDAKKTIVPIIIICLTAPAIGFYQTLYTTFSEQAFVRIINDTGKKMDRIWSDNFEMSYFEGKGNDFVISFYPVYTYDWTEKVSSNMFDYKINSLYIDLIQGDSIVTYNLPEFSKGGCETIRLTEIITTQ